MAKNNSKKICVVGLGNMGRGIFEILKKNGFEVNGCDREDNINRVLKSADVFVIAVKPQSFQELAEMISVNLKGKIAVSIMAGTKIQTIKKYLRIEKIVRTMPNLPLKVGLSVTGWVANGLTKAEENLIGEILGSFGEEIKLKNESFIDKITAISGSGPAYYFLMTEMLGKAALKYGFTKEQASKISEGTFLGAAKLMENLKESSTQLIGRVASKKGTTEAALKYLQKRSFEKTFLKAVDAARKRAEKLNR